ncbi:T9SS type A sorting domain-containing protein [Bacteroidota bacterium]
MKKLLIFLSFISFNTQAQFQVYNFNLFDTYCNNHNLHAYLSAGNAVILDFFMVSCGNCAQFAPELENIFQNFGSNTSSVKVISLEISDTATNTSISIWKQNNGSTYPTIGGHDAYLYWNDHIKPILGGTVNQIIAIIPNTSNPTNSSIPYIEIGIMDSLKIQSLYNTLATYGYHVGINSKYDQSSDIFLYPNPANNFLYLYSSEFGKSKNHKIYWNIYDMNGKKIRGSSLVNIDMDINRLKIPLNGLANGPYLLNYSSTYVSKMIKFHILR